MMIEFHNVTKSFGSRRVLDGLNLKIPEGKITVILGKSGEGKSVTIKHIMGLLKPTNGTIIVDGEDITDLEHEELRSFRQKFGMLFQHAALFDSLSVYENVIFPLREHTRLSEQEMIQKADKMLEQVGLPDYGDKMPDTLSTGEKKRVGLARALIHKPKIILYDEPTTGMDPLVCEMIDQLIVDVSRARNGELTSVVISHDLKAALNIGENIVMLYKGKVQLAGTAEEFRKTDDPIVRQFFGGKVEGPMEFL